MPLKVRHQGALRTITRLSVRVGGVLRPLKTLKIMDDGTLRTVASFVPPMSVAISPTSTSGQTASPSAGMVETSPVVCAPTGGQAPFTYQWSLVSGAVVNITTPTNASTTFSYPMFNSTRSGTARCQVTDSLGTIAQADVSFTLTHFASSGGFEP